MHIYRKPVIDASPSSSGFSLFGEAVWSRPEMARKQDIFSQEAVGARLRSVRIALTGEDNQAAFAKRLGLSGSSKLNNAETGDNYPGREILLALWQKHRIPTDFILYGEERGLPPEVAEKLGAPIKAARAS